MSRILTEILTRWNSTRPGSPEHVSEHYISHPDSIRCSVAEGVDAQIMGFQSLHRALVGNSYDVPAGWGIIGTYVALDTLRQGIGGALFSATLDAARAAAIRTIDATIDASNHRGLAYYAAMGFQSYGELDGAVRKKLDVA